ncbi:MAG TPA: TIR domain-containing protein [Thermoanaerobaculia bacterium]|nr:TIR domain-containing protein [Thermoanaerobaculia bacterium]
MSVAERRLSFDPGALAGPVVLDREHEERGTAPQVFLSHAGEDAAAVKELAHRMRQAGLDVWLDVDELQPGDEWMRELEVALDGSEAFAVYIGRTGIMRWIGREVRVALDRNTQDPRFRFIPILGPGADPKALPRFVAQHQWVDLRDGDLDPVKIRQLVGSILSRPAAAVSLLPPEEPPFRGLLTFGAEHALLFFGRDRETRELLERLRGSPFLAVIGDSGSGKSSLVRAGLIPALHRGHFQGATAARPTWRVAVLQPGSDPFRELATALLDLLPEATPAERMTTLDACARQLAQGTSGLRNAISALVPRGESTLLVVDQFEELFTQSPDPVERHRFIDTLLAASQCDGERPLYTVVTLRADFYSHCFEHPTLPGILSTSQYPVRAIDPEKLAEVIEKPAQLAGIKLEPGLVEAILFDLGGGPGNLPLLEHTLLELWKLRTGDTLTHGSYEAIGRVQGALEHHAEEVYGRFDEEERLIARKLLLGLVAPTENAVAARRRARIGEVLPNGGHRRAAEAVLEVLVDERLLLVRGSSGGGAEGEDDGERDQDDNEVEIAHEALLRGWQRQRDWLEEDREFLFWRERTLSAFEAWEDSDRDAGSLLRGAPLAEAQRWLEQRPEDLSEEGRDFIRRSLALMRRQKRIWRTVMIAIAVTGAAALVSAENASRAQREAEESLVLATTAVDEMLTQVGSEALKDVPQLEDVRRELLARARVLYEQLVGQRSSSPELELQAALAPARLAEIDRQEGEFDAARVGLKSVIAELNVLVAEEPRRPRYRLELSRIHNEAGQVAEADGRRGEAAAHYDRAVEIQQALVESDPADVEYAYELGRTHLNRGILRTDMGELETAEADYLKTIEYVERFPKPPDEWRVAYLQQRARGRNQLGGLFQRQKKQGAAAIQYRLASELFETLVKENPKSREYKTELAKIYSNLSLHQSTKGDPAEAVNYGKRAVTMFDDLADALPEIRSEWAQAHARQGLALRDVGRSQEAIDSLRRASEIFADLLNDHPKRTDDLYCHAVTLVYLGSLHSDAGERAEVGRIVSRLAEILPRLAPESRSRIERDSKYVELQSEK